MPIQVLPETVAAQIAAGEVVERPASVVKELLENALDAGASSIDIEIRDGGRRLIRVSDDGQGIPEAEAAIAFHRHSTSKLTSAADLAAIETLGFRGEALAAIASVAQVILITRAHGEIAGTRLAVEGGRIVSQEKVGAPQGTVVSVENLFYNVPARLKFLRALVTEKRHISALVTRYAAAYPTVRFRLVHDGRLVFRSSGGGELREVLVAVQGLDTVKQMLEVRGEHSGVRVYGYTSAPSLSRANRTQITFFVNGRWVQDQGLAFAVIQAYHTMLMTGRYPVVILMIDLPPTEVDVNVHPTKAEIRFRDKEAVFRAVQRSVRRALVESAPGQPVGRPVVGGDAGWTIDGRPALEAAPRASQFLSHLQAEMDLPGLRAGQRVEQDGPHAVSATSPFPALRVIGQVGASYIVAEGPGELVVIDQHAAHERILYEQYMAQRQTGIQTQALLEPFPVELTPDRASLLEDSLPALADLGFLVEHFGGSTFMVRGLPAVLGPMSPTAALEAVVDDLELGKPPMGESVEGRIVARVCKTAAIKAGQVLTPEEMSAMVRQLERCETPHTCPHGRPTMITLSAAHIARQFRRT
jgi:DNA mismatch repair protein MutL